MVVYAALAPMRPAAVLSDTLPTGQTVVLHGCVGRGVPDQATAQHRAVLGAASQRSSAYRNIGRDQPDELAVRFLLQALKACLGAVLEIRVPVDAEVDRAAHPVTSTYQCGQRPSRLSCTLVTVPTCPLGSVTLSSGASVQ